MRATHGTSSGISHAAALSQSLSCNGWCRVARVPSLRWFRGRGAWRAHDDGRNPVVTGRETALRASGGGRGAKKIRGAAVMTLC